MSILTDHIRRWEGLRLEAYQDQAGVWTIGYGHTKTAKPGMTITKEQAEDLLLYDIAWAREAVKRRVKVDLDEYQRAALISLVFNIGEGNFRKSTALKRLNAGDYRGAADAMTRFNKHRDKATGKLVFNQGLANRRESERDLFLTALSGPDYIVGSPGKAAGGEAKPMVKSKTQWLGLGGVLTSLLAIYQQVKTAAPEAIEVVGPIVVLGAIFGAIMLNRWLEARKGEH